jgi:hypothetical protein
MLFVGGGSMAEVVAFIFFPLAVIRCWQLVRALI